MNSPGALFTRLPKNIYKVGLKQMRYIDFNILYVHSTNIEAALSPRKAVCVHTYYTTILFIYLASIFLNTCIRTQFHCTPCSVWPYSSFNEIFFLIGGVTSVSRTFSLVKGREMRSETSERRDYLHLSPGLRLPVLSIYSLVWPLLLFCSCIFVDESVYVCAYVVHPFVLYML